MFQYEIAQLRFDDLLRQAEHERLVRETVRSRRAARREAARHDAEGEAHTSRPRRHRFLRAA